MVDFEKVPVLQKKFRCNDGDGNIDLGKMLLIANLLMAISSDSFCIRFDFFQRQSANGSVCIYEFTVPRQDVEAGYQVGQVNAYDPDGNEVFFERLGLTTVPFELQNENSG